MFSFFPKTELKRFLFVLCAAIITILAVAGCRRNEGAANETERNEPKRLISAAPSNTEIIIGLGMGERLIAVDPYSQGIQGIASGLPLIDFFYPDTEAVISLEPDLILANEINSFGVADNPFKLLEDLGIRVAQIPSSVSIEGIYGDITMIAEILDVPERGQALVTAMKDEIESIAAAAKGASVKSVYFEISPPPFMYSFGQGTFLNEMIEIAGGRNIFADETSWLSPSAEEIINRNPDIIFTMTYPGEDPVSEIKSRPAFEGITAVREGRVYAIDADSASRASQNIVQALREMAGAINS